MDKFLMQAEVYDAIAREAEKAGGLIRESMQAEDGSCGCMVGAAFLGGVYGDAAKTFADCYLLPKELVSLTPSYMIFDAAHRELTRNCDERLPWRVVAEKAGIVRGA